MFEWEENLFVGLKSLYRRVIVRPKEKQRVAVQVTLKEMRGELLFLGRMLSGEDVTLFETDDPTFYGRGRIFLPRKISVGPTIEANRLLYEVRTIVGALAIKYHWVGSAHARGSRPYGKPMREAAVQYSSKPPNGLIKQDTCGNDGKGPFASPRSSSRLSRLLETCFEEFPGLPGKIESLENALRLDGEICEQLGRLPVRSATRQEFSGEVASKYDLDPETCEIVSEIEGRGQDGVTVLPDSALNGQENNLPDHVFEKTETLEEYNGLLRKSDDEESLEESEEALREVNMTHLVRTPERPRSIYRADVILDGLCFETDDQERGVGVPYPEWDYKKATYKQDWCFLEERVQKDTDPSWPRHILSEHRLLLQQLKAQFHTMTSDWLRMQRQPSGNEFDIDAIVNTQVVLRSGHTPSENVYLDLKRDLHDVAAMILLDQSYSTDAWLNGLRVIDVINESIFCVGEVLEDYVETFSIAGFSSNTRRNCRFNVLKGFEESWGDVRGRLGCVEPNGYTRIGPALRHAHEQLLNQAAARRVVILVTDGRPCDYDRYEGMHGVQDVKKAIECGLQNRIHTHAFAIEKQAAEYFPQMFKGKHFDILASPDKLSGSLVRLFARLLTG